jgi:hypothetical protein
MVASVLIAEETSVAPNATMGTSFTTDQTGSHTDKRLSVHAPEFVALGQIAAAVCATQSTDGLRTKIMEAMAQLVKIDGGQARGCFCGGCFRPQRNPSQTLRVLF